MKREHTHTKKKKRSEIEALRAKSCREGREREQYYLCDYSHHNGDRFCLAL